jgi:hypothetical protein
MKHHWIMKRVNEILTLLIEADQPSDRFTRNTKMAAKAYIISMGLAETYIDERDRIIFTITDAGRDYILSITEYSVI